MYKHFIQIGLVITSFMFFSSLSSFYFSFTFLCMDLQLLKYYQSEKNRMWLYYVPSSQYQDMIDSKPLLNAKTETRGTAIWLSFLFRKKLGFFYTRNMVNVNFAKYLQYQKVVSISWAKYKICKNYWHFHTQMIETTYWKYYAANR